MTDSVENEIELESIASEYIGKIVLKFSELETNINLCLKWAVHAKDFDTVNPLVERLSFKSKIDALLDIIEIKFNSSPECISEFKAWHRKLDKFRVKRNSFIHGHWGFLHRLQKVVNYASIGSNKPKETLYGVSDLKHELLAIERISKDFHIIRNKWLG
jgi:hypothetical protein